MRRNGYWITEASEKAELHRNTLLNLEKRGVIHPSRSVNGRRHDVLYGIDKKYIRCIIEEVI